MNTVRKYLYATAIAFGVLVLGEVHTASNTLNAQELSTNEDRSKKSLQRSSKSKDKSSKVWEVMNSNLGLVIIGFILTTVAGAIINNRYQKTTWEREKKYTILTRSLTKGVELIQSVSEVTNKRLFGMRRVIWAIGADNAGEVDNIWKEYYATVIEWNTHLIFYYSSLKLRVGIEIANEFLQEEDQTVKLDEENLLKYKLGIHGRYRFAHDRVLKVYRNYKSQKPVGDKEIADVEELLIELNEDIDLFIARLTNESLLINETLKGL